VELATKIDTAAVGQPYVEHGDVDIIERDVESVFECSGFGDDV
jgi:hypothetical protein